MPKRELFRVAVGGYFNGEGDQWWNYGIADEGDFNGDGVPDYSWYGGDDSGSEMYLFISSGNTYQRVDVLKTVEAAWKQRFNKAAPDLGDCDSDYFLRNTVIEHTAAGLVLDAKVGHSSLDGGLRQTYHFTIGQADFKP